MPRLNSSALKVRSADVVKAHNLAIQNVQNARAAEVLLNHELVGQVRALSAGTRPQPEVAGSAIEALRLAGLPTAGLLVLALKKGHRWAARLAYPLLAVTLFALVLVKLVGKTAGGAQRWIPLGPVNLQPAELAKVALVLYLAHSLARKQGKVRLFSIGLLPHLLVTLAMVGLCLWQRDLGTGFILFVVLFAMLFAAGAKVGYLFGLVLIAIPAGWHIIKSTEYRYQRWLAFMNPEQYKTTFGFQLWESLLGTANGGWLGQGLGQGKGKLFYLPAAHTDFIAAVIAEEAGLIGILLLLTLYAVVIWRGVRAALRAAEPFGCYAAFGVTVLVAAQALVNLGVVFGLLPTKGLTLPFVSYGGSSLLAMLAGAGVLLAVSTERGGFLSAAPGAVYRYRMRSLAITDDNLTNQKEAVKQERRLSFDNQRRGRCPFPSAIVVFRPVQEAPKPKCSACGGTGKKITKACRSCAGRGKISHPESIKVKIPAGADTGSRVRLKGMGGAGQGGVHDQPGPAVLLQLRSAQENIRV